MTRQLFLVWTDAVQGQDAKFNDWYTNTHLADVLKIPGIVAAQRFEMVSGLPLPGEQQSRKYLAIYELETDNIDNTLEKLNAAAGTSAMPLTDAMDGARVQTAIYTPISNRAAAR